MKTHFCLINGCIMPKHYAKGLFILLENSLDFRIFIECLDSLPFGLLISKLIFILFHEIDHFIFDLICLLTLNIFHLLLNFISFSLYLSSLLKLFFKLLFLLLEELLMFLCFSLLFGFFLGFFLFLFCLFLIKLCLFCLFKSLTFLVKFLP